MLIFVLTVGAKSFPFELCCVTVLLYMFLISSSVFVTLKQSLDRCVIALITHSSIPVNKSQSYSFKFKSRLSLTFSSPPNVPGANGVLVS